MARPIWRRAEHALRPRIALYALLSGLAAATAGPFLVLVLLACGVAELARHELRDRDGGTWTLLAAAVEPGGTAALVWTSLKVGALAFGGGFVIVPLMQADAVGAYHWMTHAQFLNAVALGQVTPGPLLQTVAAVGYSAAGIPGGLLAAAVAFAPSFSFILIGAARFERLLSDGRVLAFLGGAAPAAAGAIVGSAVPLTAALSVDWQYAVLAGAAIALFALRRSVVATLLLAGAAGLLLALLGAPVPG